MATFIRNTPAARCRQRPRPPSPASHPRKAREFVHHSPDVVDLADDGIGALLEDAFVLDDDLPNLRLIRSAESWIGVNGFLISWAIRRATSPQRSALRGHQLVMSSSVMM